MTEKSTPEGVTPIGDAATGSGHGTTGRGLSGVTFLTVAEVAALMRVSKMSVYRLIHAGELEAVRFGRSFRVPEAAVNTYLRDAFYETG
jgi:excisionase family DNA binding protein